MSLPVSGHIERRWRPQRRLAAAALLAVLCAAGLQGSAEGRARAIPRAHASTRVTWGISDNTVAMFGDPRFRWLRPSVARLVVPWDVVNNPTELAWDTAWLEAARADGVRALVVFEKNPRHPRQLPSVSAYGRAVGAFISRFPYVRDYTPWNEENHFMQPTVKAPKRAAEYFNLLSAYCPACSITAADVLDVANMSEWVQKFLRYAHQPRLWGMHNYADLSSGRSTHTAQLLKLVPGQVWFTETGGVVWRYERPKGHRGYYNLHSESYAAAGARRLTALAATSPRITRIYYYQWRVSRTLAWVRRHGKVSWDSGLLRPDCSVRQAFLVVARAMGRDALRVPRARRNATGNCV
jgi:hypothetical protein